MRYRDFIQDNFLIDDQETGKLVPFIFRPIQNKYYDILCKDYDIERRGISAPIREDILKARKEGFTSLILALFAADDIVNDNPTESELISYKDDATKQFRKRYRTFILSFFARLKGVSVEKIQKNINVLEEFAPSVFVIDSNSGEYKLRRNGARFYCGTASARTGERGGTLHKLLFSEHAHYPDTPNMSAKEIVIGTTEQVSFNSGWIFKETTANGVGNFHYNEWWSAYRGESRFRGRFFGWRDHYTPEQFAIIASQFTDKKILKQEYPETPEEAFITTGSSYFDNERIAELLKKAVEPKAVGFLRAERGEVRFVSDANGPLKIWEFPNEYDAYVIGGDVAEGIEGGDWSVLKVINNSTMRTAAKFRARIAPDEFARAAYLLGNYYNKAYMGIEVNKDGFWVNSELVEMNYPNLYFQQVLDEVSQKTRKKFGWKTDGKSRPLMLAELNKMLNLYDDIWMDKDFLGECLSFVRNEAGRPESLAGNNDDDIFATAIAFMIRENAPKFVKDRPKELSYEDMRKQEIAEAIERANAGKTRQWFSEDYTNL